MRMQTNRHSASAQGPPTAPLGAPGAPTKHFKAEQIYTCSNKRLLLPSIRQIKTSEQTGCMHHKPFILSTQSQQNLLYLIPSNSRWVSQGPLGGPPGKALVLLGGPLRGPLGGPLGRPLGGLLGWPLLGPLVGPLGAPLRGASWGDRKGGFWGGPSGGPFGGPQGGPRGGTQPQGAPHQNPDTHNEHYRGVAYLGAPQRIRCIKLETVGAHRGPFGVSKGPRGPLLAQEALALKGLLSCSGFEALVYQRLSVQQQQQEQPQMLLVGCRREIQTQLSVHRKLNRRRILDCCTL